MEGLIRPEPIPGENPPTSGTGRILSAPFSPDVRPSPSVGPVRHRARPPSLLAYRTNSALKKSLMVDRAWARLWVLKPKMKIFPSP